MGFRFLPESLDPANRPGDAGHMRICSLLPAATEILYALGLGDSIVAVSSECDYPPEAQGKPVVVESRVDTTANAAEIDRQVRDLSARGESLYWIDQEKFLEIRPDLIITQKLCGVCAATPADLGPILASLPVEPRVIVLHPHSLDGVWEEIRRIGTVTGRAKESEALVGELERRMGAVDERVALSDSRPVMLCLEWIDPPFAAGHWVPEMVARAGGFDVMGKPSEPSFRLDWERVVRSGAELLVVMPCGYGLEQTVKEVHELSLPKGWEALPAVQVSRVYAVDANSYFSRPGPRLVTGIEILAHLLHPELAPVSPPPGSIAQL